MPDNHWTTIIPGDKSTLPTEADADVIWRFRDGTRLIQAWDFDWQLGWPLVVAWVPIPPYTSRGCRSRHTRRR